MISSESAQMFLLPSIDFWAKIIGVFSSAILGVFTGLTVILGFLTFNNFRIKKQAEEEVEKIVKIRNGMDKLYQSLLLILGESSKAFGLIKKIAESAEGQNKKIIGLSRKLEYKNANVGKINSEIKSAQMALDKTLSSLATVSSPRPQIHSYLEDIASKIASDTDYNRKIVEKALDVRLKQLGRK